MVGQDVRALDACCEWIKVMTYGHALGPASLPFELLGLADWLTGITQARGGLERALPWLSEVTRLQLPLTRTRLREEGLSPQALWAEVRRGRADGVSTLLAGIELVEIEGVACLHPEQIRADLDAFRAAGADGLVVSWDLWYIPLERLELVRRIWVLNEMSGEVTQ
jgi:hypothetical protein